MSGIKTSTGLISGIDTGALIDALINAERAPARRLESRLQNVQAVQTGIGALQAQLLSLSTVVSPLKDYRSFNKLTVSNTDTSQLTVSTRSTSLAGNYQFQAVRLASTHRAISRGFANADTQQIGTAGKLVISRENQLDRPVRLELLNGAQGVRRGTIRITDRSGESASIDLSAAANVDDVVWAINLADIGVKARVVDGHFVVEDTTGQTTNNLIISDVNGGHAAADLGIAQSVAGNTLTGSDVFTVTGDFTLSQLNDGGGLRNITGSPELSATLQDGTVLTFDFDGDASLNDVLSTINDHTDNAGKLTASLANGRLVLTDNTTGSGTFSVANLNNSNATDVLGLESTPSGNVLTGQRLIGGANSVLLRNLRGGQGISQLGEVTLTDRTGTTATIDLSSAETLDDVIEAINSAESSGSVKLQLSAELNANGNGITITDTSGSTASHLIIADVGGGTLADELGIAVDSDTNSINSGSIGLQTVNAATLLSTYSPKGGSVSTGSFRITDSAGNQAVINVTSAVKTVGDVIDAINNATGINVTARLNDTGDGIALVDDAAGSGTLTVEEAGGRTAADLRLLGSGTVGSSGNQEIISRKALVVDVEATDTLNTITSKLNLIGGTVRANVVNTGALVNGYRLTFASTISGDAGRFVVDDGGIGLNVTTQDVGRDALLRVGGNAETGFLIAGSSNTFSNTVGFLDITLNSVSDVPASVSTTLDKSAVTSTLQAFVTAYNSYVDLSNGLTKYDTTTSTRSALQGVATPTIILNRFNTLVNTLFATSDKSIRSLSDVGVRLTTNGKLTFDSERLSDALDSAPQEVQDLFSASNTGFGALFDKALNSYNDQYDGSLTAQYDALQSNVDELTARIASIDDRLTTRRTILETQFANLESTLSGLQSQQTALTGLSNVLSNLKSSSSSS
ncbi:flagellar filament capping protein FliD [bacterium]|nr:flagellar filament capping protein FliD [bacterium]